MSLNLLQDPDNYRMRVLSDPDRDDDEEERRKRRADFSRVQSGSSSAPDDDPGTFFQNPLDAAKKAVSQQVGLTKQAGAGLGEVLPIAAEGAGNIIEGLTPYEVPGLDAFSSLVDRRREESAPQGAGQHVARMGGRMLGEGALASTGGIGLASKGAKVAGIGGLLSDLGISNIIAQAGPEESLAGGGAAVADALGADKAAAGLAGVAEDPIKRALFESLGVAGFDALFRGAGRALSGTPELRPRKADETPGAKFLEDPDKLPIADLDEAPIGFEATAPRAPDVDVDLPPTSYEVREVSGYFTDFSESKDFQPLPGEAIRRPGGAAVRNEHGKIMEAPWHFAAFEKLGIKLEIDKPLPPGVVDGFVTNKGRFVNRAQADMIAEAAGQKQGSLGGKSLDALDLNDAPPAEQALSGVSANTGKYRKIGDDLWEAPDGSQVSTLDVAGALGTKEAVENARKIKGRLDELAQRGVHNPEAQASMRAKIQSGSGKRWNIRNWGDVKNYFSGLYVRFLDRDWKVAGKKLDSLGIDPKRNPYFTARTLYGAAGPGSHWFRRGFTDINDTKILAPSFEDIIKTSKNPNALDEALVAMRALDYPMAKDGSRGGFTKAEIDSGLANLQNPDIKAAAIKWKQLQDAILDRLENGNAPLVKKGTKAKILASGKGANEYYVPFVRSAYKYLKSTAGFTHEPAALRIRDPGTQGDIYSPLETMAQNLFVLSELMLRRQNMAALAESAAKGNPALVDVTESVGAIKPLETGKGSALDGILSEEILENLTEETRDMLRAYTNAEGDVLIKIKNAAGEDRIFKTDMAVLDALTILAPRDFKMWERMMIGSSRVLRTTIVGSMNWLSTAFGRDLLTSAITKWMPDTPAWRVDVRVKAALMDGAWGAYELTKDALNRGLGTNFTVDDLIRLRETTGGSIGELTGGERAEMSREIGYLLPHTLTTYGKVRRFMHMTAEALVTPGRILENAPRAGEMRSVYNWARAQGMDHENAAVFAAAKNRDVTIDFLRHGAAFKTGGGEKLAGFDGELLRLSDAFYNVGLVGWDRMARAFLDPATRKQAAAASVALVTVPSIGLWAINTQLDPEMALDYYNIDELQRRLYWHVPIPGISADIIPDALRYDPQEEGGWKNLAKPFAVGGAGHVWFRWPKPFEYGLLFGAVPEMILESFDPRNPYRETAIQEITRRGEEAVTDQLVALVPFPTIGDVANVNPFEAWTTYGKRGAISDYEEASNKADIAKGYDQGSAGAQLIGEAGQRSGLFDVSPPKVDEAVASQFGTYGRTLSDFIQREVDKANGIAPSRRFHEQQLLSRFFRGSGESLGGEAQSKFWDELRALEKKYNTSKDFLDTNPRMAFEFGLPEEELDRLNVLQTFADDINDWREELEMLENNTVDPETGEDLPTDPEERRIQREAIREGIRLRYQIATFTPEARNRLAQTKPLTSEEKEYIKILNRLDEFDKETTGSLVRPR